VILDTSILVEIDRNNNPAKISKLDQEGPHKISSITVSEFFAGVYVREKSEVEKAQRIMAEAREIPLEGGKARKSGELIGRKHKRDLGLDLNDIYIAATALVEGEKVLTKDTSDFEEIEELEVQDWKDF